MAFMWIEVLAPENRIESVRRMAEESGASEIVVGPADATGRQLVRVLAGEIDRQDLLDRVQSLLQDTEGWRIVVEKKDVIYEINPAGNKC